MALMLCKFKVKYYSKKIVLRDSTTILTKGSRDPPKKQVNIGYFTHL